MNADSKRIYTHRTLKRALRAGRYAPGEHLDVAALADEYGVSGLPIRAALQRLLGEGLIEDHQREGMHVPLPGESELRQHYEWMQRLTMMACDMPVRPAAPAPSTPAPDSTNVAAQTWALFDSIAEAIDLKDMRAAIRLANDRLAPIRHAKLDLLPNAEAELAELYRLWQQRDLASLKAELHIYFERRKVMASRIVATLQARRAQR
ncbi:GntR family transcriptional regulator [Luteimonas sp. S4-F44]|uniref:GntR family transcriptional regulator n=1 Tax=Luteimonas sp. S4-F44 TaxID=2925842 RepID=UPI001F52C914|nr:GntR family transcriptional regulator [Luteimonas sp. S4-F44]UNK42128.1 GntR family transcriptional regulator [Luteimonas sp. S4-F44]